MTKEVKYEVYSPTSLIGIFNNALKLPATVTLIYLKGRYAFGGVVSSPENSTVY